MKAMQKPKAPSRDATTETVLHDDGKFVRTALVVGPGKAGSVDVVALVNGVPVRLCEINIIQADGDDHLIVDVIDVDRRYKIKRALSFSPTDRNELPILGTLVSADFRKGAQ